jgi:Uma2 family endonuclease
VPVSRRKRRSVEPDECYWIQTEFRVCGKDSIDLNHDPPPDLLFEIAVSHSSLDRLAIYASLDVPEVWRFNGQHLVVHLLEASDRFHESETSWVFPFLGIKEIERFLGMRSAQSETELVRMFRAWVRDRVADNWQ